MLKEITFVYGYKVTPKQINIGQNHTLHGDCITSLLVNTNEVSQHKIVVDAIKLFKDNIKKELDINTEIYNIIITFFNKIEI